MDVIRKMMARNSLSQGVKGFDFSYFNSRWKMAYYSSTALYWAVSMLIFV